MRCAVFNVGRQETTLGQKYSLLGFAECGTDWDMAIEWSKKLAIYLILYTYLHPLMAFFVWRFVEQFIFDKTNCMNKIVKFAKIHSYLEVL